MRKTLSLALVLLGLAAPAHAQVGDQNLYRQLLVECNDRMVSTIASLQKQVQDLQAQLESAKAAKAEPKP